MQIVIDVPEKYYKDAKRMVWSSTYSGSLISGWLRNAIPVTEKDGYFVTDGYDYTANMCTTQDRRCDSCEHSSDGHINDTETCHECMWDSKYKPRRE